MKLRVEKQNEERRVRKKSLLKEVKLFPIVTTKDFLNAYETFYRDHQVTKILQDIELC